MPPSHTPLQRYSIPLYCSFAFPSPATFPIPNSSSPPTTPVAGEGFIIQDHGVVFGNVDAVNIDLLDPDFNTSTVHLLLIDHSWLNDLDLLDVHVLLTDHDRLGDFSLLVDHDLLVNHSL